MIEEPQVAVTLPRDLAVLRAVVAHFQEHGRQRLLAQHLAERLGMEKHEVQRAGENLARQGLVQVSGGWGDRVVQFEDISADALRLTGAWPTPETVFERMVAALERIANDTKDPEQTHARDALSAFRNAGDGLRQALGAAALGEDETP